jgi:hypothetical protein
MLFPPPYRSGLQSLHPPRSRSGLRNLHASLSYRWFLELRTLSSPYGPRNICPLPNHRERPKFRQRHGCTQLHLLQRNRNPSAPEIFGQLNQCRSMMNTMDGQII